METNKIYFRNGFFRQLNGRWTCITYEHFGVQTYQADGEKKTVSYVIGHNNFGSPPHELAGPFATPGLAQEALDNFFMGDEYGDT